MSSELIISVSVLVAEIVLFAICIVRGKRPPTLGQVRVFPYRLAQMFLIVLILVTAAHVISLITGSSIKPRRMKGMT